MDRVDEERLEQRIIQIVRKGLEGAHGVSVDVDKKLSLMESDLAHIRRDVETIKSEFKNGAEGPLKEQLAVLKFQVRQQAKIIWFVGTSSVTALAGAAWSLLQQRL